jgi:ABC-type glycerol-3-phosphate transport system substrate-binding protein
MQNTVSRREFLKMAALGSGAALLAACVPATPAIAPAAGETAPAAKEALEIQWWSFGLGLPSDIWPHGKWEGQLAETYMKEHPDVKIAYQAMGWDSLVKLYASITAGNPPNLVLRGGIDQILYALEGDVALEVELPQELKDDLPEGWYESMLFQGKNYMVPFYTLAAGMVLNISIVEEAGATDLLPEPPARAWDFDQYLELMKKCTFQRSDGTQVWGAVFSIQQTNPFFYWPEQVLSWNWGTDTVEYRDGQWRCKLGEEAGLAWLQWMQDLYFKHKVIPNPSGLSASRWEYWDQKTLLSGIGPDIGWSRRPGMSVDPETLVVHDSERDFDWIFVQAPTNKGVPHSMVWGGSLLDVNTVPFRIGGPDAIQATVDFALWLVNSENQKWLAQYLLPIRKSAIADVKDPMLKWHYENWIPYGRQRASANGGRAREVTEALELVLQKIYLPMSPSEAVQDFCNTVQSLKWFGQT